jgi:hypothetical protein
LTVFESIQTEHQSAIFLFDIERAERAERSAEREGRSEGSDIDRSE